MEKYTAEPAKAHLSNDIETIRIHSIIKNRTDTKLSKEYWGRKYLKAQPQLQFYILKRCRPTKRTGINYLCLKEKPFIIEQQGKELLKQKNELTSKCRF